jgi:hypothetical protein
VTTKDLHVVSPEKIVPYPGEEGNSKSFCPLRVTTLSMTVTSNKEQSLHYLPPLLKKNLKAKKMKKGYWPGFWWFYIIDFHL